MKTGLLSVLACLFLIIRLNAQTVPTPAHVVVVMMENHGYSEIIGTNTGAPYINSLAVDSYAASFTNSLAITHPSQPNYLYLFSGASQGVLGDLTPASFQLPFTTANLGAELTSTGHTFKGFSEDLPSVGFTGDTYNNYARKHAPWVNWQGTSTNGIPATLAQPFDSFPTNYNNLPTLCWVIPNLNDDMHNGTIAQGDAWVQAHMDSYIQWAKTHNSLLILTYDEDENSIGNSTPITTIFIGQMVKMGQYNEQIDHNRVLRTMEDMYGLGHAGASSTPSPITDCWVYKPISGLSATPRSVCQGQQVTVLDSSSNSPLNWWWSFPGGSPSTATGQHPPVVTYNAPGTYNMTLITYNHMGYDTLVKPAYVTVTGPPVISVPDSISLCSGNNSVITASGATNYTWWPSTNVVSTNNNVLTVNPTGNMTYYVTGSTNGCPGDTAHVRVFVSPVVTPSVSIATSPATTVCANEAITQTAVAVSGGNNPAYQWLVNGNIAGGISSTYNTFASNSYSIQCILTSNALCATRSKDTSSAVMVTVNPSPMMYITDTICMMSSYNFQGRTLTSPGTYWDTLSTVNGCDSIFRLSLAVGGMLGSYTNISICTGDSYLFNGQSYSTAGVYADTLLASGGCDSVATLNLTVTTPPTVAWGNGADTVFTGNGPVALTGATPTGGTYSGTGVSNDAFYPDSTGPGHYTITYTVGNGCNGSVTKTYVVLATGINSIPQSELAIFPNPVQNELTIRLAGFDISNTQSSVFDITGRKVFAAVTKQANALLIDTHLLAAGTYFVKVNTMGRELVGKFAKSE